MKFSIHSLQKNQFGAFPVDLCASKHNSELEGNPFEHRQLKPVSAITVFKAVGKVGLPNSTVSHRQPRERESS